MLAPQPSLLNTLRPDIQQDPELFKTGDVGIIIRPNGDYRIITSGIDAERLAGDPANYTDVERAQIKMGEKLLAIGLALSNDMIMDVLLKLAANPDILDPVSLDHVRHPH